MGVRENNEHQKEIIMSNHTPGPWKCSLTSHHYYDYRLDGPNSQLVFDKEQGYANAKLIASAPELLEALKQAESFIGREETYPGELREALNNVRNAIAKAEGWS